MSDANPTVETVTVTVDGLQVRVPKGTRILDACAVAGVDVPHYCYHPELSAPAQCRMCLVEVEKSPKLVAACTGTVADGQVILTESQSARTARQGVLEFYLVNHPLDCPVCDQSGECKLQDYTSAEGRAMGRSKEPKRVLGRDDFGGDVLFYAREKLARKGCDLLVVNAVGDGRAFEVDSNDGWLLAADGNESALEHGSKTVMASRIVDAIVTFLRGRTG